MILKYVLASVLTLAYGPPVLAEATPDIVVEKSFKKDQRRVDFEDTQIDGQKRSPTIENIIGSQTRSNSTFFKVRTQWHPEMIESTTQLVAP
jgi:hypothetical protein